MLAFFYINFFCKFFKRKILFTTFSTITFFKKQIITQLIFLLRKKCPNTLCKHTNCCSEDHCLRDLQTFFCQRCNKTALVCNLIFKKVNNEWLPLTKTIRIRPSFLFCLYNSTTYLRSRSVSLEICRTFCFVCKNLFYMIYCML